MKNLFLLTAAAIIALPTVAGAKSHTESLELPERKFTITELSESELAERLGYCDQPKVSTAHLAPGSIVIWYERNEKGECKAHVKQVK